MSQPQAPSMTHHRQYIVGSWLPADANLIDLKQACRESISSPESSLDTAFRLVLSHNSFSDKALAYLEDEMMSGAVRHHGAHFTLSMKGKPRQVIGHCGLSQTACEQLVLQAAKLSIHDKQVIAVASAVIAKQPESMSEVHTLEFRGFVCMAAHPSHPSQTPAILL